MNKFFGTAVIILGMVTLAVADDLTTANSSLIAPNISIDKELTLTPLSPSAGRTEKHVESINKTVV